MCESWARPESQPRSAMTWRVVMPRHAMSGRIVLAAVRHAVAVGGIGRSTAGARSARGATGT